MHQAITTRFTACALLVMALAGAAPAQSPFMYLDHVAISLDSATLEAIRSSRFVRDTLAGTRDDTVVTEDGTWAGLRITGENNFLGLSAAGDTASELVLRCEQRGCSRDIVQILESMSPGTAASELRHSTSGGRSRPSYYRTWAPEMKSGPFFCWMYEPYPDSTVPDRELGRKAMNARSYRPKRFLGSITGVDIALPADAARRLTNRLSAFRFSAMFTGSATRLLGPDLRITLAPAAGLTPRITRIVFALNRTKKGEKVYRFGTRSVLTFDNATKTASWTF